MLCFPFIFRGALDVGATQINEAMKLAAVHAIAELARAEASDIVANAYGGDAPRFGPDYLIPKPFDPRLICRIAPAVAQAAMDSGVATRPLDDLDAYRQRMERFVYHSGTSMKPVFQAAKAAPKRVIYAEGEEERVLRAVQVVVDEGIAFPVLLGRADVIARRIETLGLRLKVGETCEVVNILSDPRYPSVVAEYYELGRRRGVTQAIAKEAMRSRASLIAAMLLRRGDVDAMLCGTVGTFHEHSALRARGDRKAAGRADLGCHEHADAARPAALHLRHLRQPASHCGRGGGDDAARRRRDAPLRRDAGRSPALAFELRQLGCA